MKNKQSYAVCVLAFTFWGLSSLVFADASSTVSSNGHSLIGKWKSNAELTVQSLNQIEGISEQSLKYLKQNVLGRLTVEFTNTTTRSYFGQAKSDDKFSPYKVLQQTDGFSKIEHTDPLTGKIIISPLYWQNDCYYELVSKWQYKEFFCPATEKKKFIAIPASRQINN